MSADQLLSILKADAELQREDLNREPQSCPNDGTPYRTGPNGELFCPFDGYRPLEGLGASPR